MGKKNRNNNPIKNSFERAQQEQKKSSPPPWSQIQRALEREETGQTEALHRAFAWQKKPELNKTVLWQKIEWELDRPKRYKKRVAQLCLPLLLFFVFWRTCSFDQNTSYDRGQESVHLASQKSEATKQIEKLGETGSDVGAKQSLGEGKAKQSATIQVREGERKSLQPLPSFAQAASAKTQRQIKTVLREPSPLSSTKQGQSLQEEQALTGSAKEALPALAKQGQSLGEEGLARQDIPSTLGSGEESKPGRVLAVEALSLQALVLAAEKQENPELDSFGLDKRQDKKQKAAPVFELGLAYALGSSTVLNTWVREAWQSSSLNYTQIALQQRFSVFLRYQVAKKQALLFQVQPLSKDQQRFSSFSSEGRYEDLSLVWHYSQVQASYALQSKSHVLPSGQEISLFGEASLGVLFVQKLERIELESVLRQELENKDRFLPSFALRFGQSLYSKHIRFDLGIEIQSSQLLRERTQLLQFAAFSRLAYRF